MNTIYSLHVGIDQYHPQSNVPNLGGCVNDVKELLNFLEKAYPEAQLKSKTLLNEQATYQNIVDQFGAQHLLQAQANDVVLIQYAGHGSQANAAVEFTRYFPDKKDETWICYDSRIPGGLDLADKELSVLIDRIAAKEVHVVVIMDCCHSGSGTRGANEIQYRQHSNREDVRMLDSYLNGYFSNKFPNGAKVILPNPKHVLLAACDQKEKAGEINGSGLFTSNLVKVLTETNGDISYNNLFSKVQIELAKKTTRQHPQFEPYGFFNVQSGFLQNNIKDNQKVWQLINIQGKWVVKRGIIHGLSMEPGKQATFRIFDHGIFVGHATTKTVLVEESIVELDVDLDPQVTYDAQMISFPANRYPIELSTSVKGKNRLDTVLENYNPLFFELHPEVKSKYKFEVCDDEVTISRLDDPKILRTITGGDETKIFQDAFEMLEIIGRREKMLQIENKYRKIADDAIVLELSLLDDNDTIAAQKTGEIVNVPIPFVNGKEKAVPFLMSLKNTYPNRDLYCSLLYFTENFDIINLYNGKIPANKTALAVEKDADGEAPFFLLNGKQQATDTFKLFVSTRPLSTYLLEMQNNIKLGEVVNYPVTRSGISGLVNQDKTIANLKAEANESFTDDWFCKTMDVVSTSNRVPSPVSDNEEISTRTVAPAMSVSALLNENDPKPIKNESPATIKVLPHLSFNGTVSKVSSIQPTRNVNDIYSILQREENSDLTLFNFNDESTRSGEQLQSLEITNFSNEEVLKNDPLKIQLKSNSHEELVLPITFDGEHIIPVGASVNDGQGNINVEINHLPESTEAKRSLVKAIKLYFVKTVMGKKNATKLQWVDYQKEKPTRKSGRIVGKVKDAQNIVLLIHGIIGDTKPFLKSMKKAVDNGTADLILTFDYENLNTPIQQTALFLKEQLSQVGIDEKSNLPSGQAGKKITIVAHSMGGLVARHFIEKLGGNKVVNRLIMAGTPNMGSKIADLTTYRSWATTLFTLAANSGIGIPAAATVVTALNFTKNLTVTLEQMQPSDDFLTGLKSSADPNVEYHIIAGDFEQYCKSCSPQEKRLVDKLYNVSGALFYRNEEHDIAVSVNSIESVSQSRAPKPTVEYVSCHHLNYFEVQDSLNKIIHWIGFEDPLRSSAQ